MLEVQMSAMLAWLLNPRMEHGLGHEFLSRFIGSVSDECPELKEIADGLCNRLHGDAVCEFDIYLERTVKKEGKASRVDMVISLDHKKHGAWIIGVENKIKSDSAADKEQLNKEYSGLQKEYSDKNICLIFLVPTKDGKDGGELDDQVRDECKAFNQPEGILKLMTWQRNNGEPPSVISLLEKLLSDESDGIIEPISDYTRHTLKALIMFIRGNFSGYDREKQKKQSGNFSKIKTHEIITKISGFVGTSGGLIGFIRQSTNGMKDVEYQYSDSDNPPNANWISVDDFKQIYNWRKNATPPNFIWDRRYLRADILYDIVSACPLQSLYIGIQGGLDALKDMKPEEIKDQKWQLLTSDEPPTKEWISGKDFLNTLDAKGVRNMWT